MVLSAIGRMIWVPIAFVLSALVAGFLLMSFGLEQIVVSMHGSTDDVDRIAVIFNLIRHAQVLVAGLTVVPAIAVVAIGEIGRIRSGLYYIIGGGLALSVIPLLARLGYVGSVDGTPLSLPPAAVWQVFATAGFAGGALYWLLAGRRA